MKNKLKAEWREFLVLIKSVPAPVFALFVLAVFAMNLLANKSISLPVSYLALDAGILVSWATFLTMDILTKRFGPKAASELSVLAIFFNLIFCLLFFFASLIPGIWGESAAEGVEALINGALDRTFGGTWYVLFGSTIAFLASALINNFSNFFIGKLFHKNPNGFLAYGLRSYLSTALGQFADNLIFALIVSHFFFGWSLLQCVTCALTGMAAELLCEVLFSYFGFRICARWEKDGIGEEYLHLKNRKEEKK